MLYNAIIHLKHFLTFDKFNRLMSYFRIETENSSILSSQTFRILKRNNSLSIYLPWTILLTLGHLNFHVTAILI
jgi:uncharacterized protein YjbK